MKDLTQRELEIWKLVAEGVKQDDISELLNIPPRTVAYVVSELKARLECRSIADLTRAAITHKIIEL